MPVYHRDSDRGTPWYVSATYKLGAPTVIALFLVWFLVHNVTAQLTDFKTTLTNVESVTATTARDLKEYQKQSADKMDDLISLAKLQCINSSIQAGTDKRECFK